MSAFKRVKASDLITVPYVANKQWDFSYSDFDSYGIEVYTGQKMTGSFDPLTDPVTANGQYQRLVYDSINHQFYQKFSGSLLDPTSLLLSNNYESASIYRPSGSYNNSQNTSYGYYYYPEDIGSLIHVLKIPAKIYGNSINPGTFNLSSSFYNIQDDSNGNLIDSGSYVGNIFYSHGVAVITNQAYQSYFTDTSIVDIHWSNFNTPSGFNVSSNLQILINGQIKVFSSGSQNGRLIAKVGDTILCKTWSDDSWPSQGVPANNLAVTGYLPISSSVNGAYLTQSFSFISQSTINVNSYSSYIPASLVKWSNFNTPNNVPVSNSLYIAVNNTQQVLSSNNSSGSFYALSGSVINVQSSGSGPWPTQGSSERYLSITDYTVQSSSLSGSVLTQSFTVNGEYDISIKSYTNYSYTQPSYISWSLFEASSSGNYSVTAGFNISDEMGNILFGNQNTPASGNLQLPSYKTVRVNAHSYTNDNSSSVWGVYSTASLVNNVYGITHTNSLYKSARLINRNTGTQSLSTPLFTLVPGLTYYFDVYTSNPGPVFIPVVNYLFTQYTNTSSTYVVSLNDSTPPTSLDVSKIYKPYLSGSLLFNGSNCWVFEGIVSSSANYVNVHAGPSYTSCVQPVTTTYVFYNTGSSTTEVFNMYVNGTQSLASASVLGNSTGSFAITGSANSTSSILLEVIGGYNISSSTYLSYRSGSHITASAVAGGPLPTYISASFNNIALDVTQEVDIIFVPSGSYTPPAYTTSGSFQADITNGSPVTGTLVVNTGHTVNVTLTVFGGTSATSSNTGTASTVDSVINLAQSPAYNTTLTQSVTVGAGTYVITTTSQTDNNKYAKVSFTLIS